MFQTTHVDALTILSYWRSGGKSNWEMDQHC